MKFFDDKSKKNLKWWNKNYFFATTIAMIAMMLILFAIRGTKHYLITDFDSRDGVFYQFLNFQGFAQNIINTFAWAGWSHVIANSVEILLCGLYLERKVGSLPFLGLIVFFVPISALFDTANTLSIHWAGTSGLGFALFGYVLIDYIFSFQKHKRNKTNIIYGATILAFIYLWMCINPYTGKWINYGEYHVGLEWYPYDLLYNAGHYGGFLSGLLSGLVIQITALWARKTYQLKTQEDTISNDKNDAQVEEKVSQPKEKNQLILPLVIEKKETKQQKVEEVAVEPLKDKDESSIQLESTVEENKIEEVPEQIVEETPQEEKIVEVKNVEEKVVKNKSAKQLENQNTSNRDALLKRMKKDVGENI